MTPDEASQEVIAGFGSLIYRELRILRLIVEGRTNKEIAAGVQTFA